MLPDGKRFLLNRYGLQLSEVTASNLLALDADGNVLEGEGEFEKTAFYIHSRIHLANPRAACVLHTPHAVRHDADSPRERPARDGRAERAALSRGYCLRRTPITAWSTVPKRRLARVLGASASVPRQSRRDRRRADGRRAFDASTTSSARAGCRCWRARWRRLKACGRRWCAETYRNDPRRHPKYAGAHFGALKRILDRESRVILAEAVQLRPARGGAHPRGSRVTRTTCCAGLASFERSRPRSRRCAALRATQPPRPPLPRRRFRRRGRGLRLLRALSLALAYRYALEDSIYVRDDLQAAASAARSSASSSAAAKSSATGSSSR